MNKDPVFGMGPNENNIPKPYLRIRKPTVLRVRPSNLGVITYYFVGFGDTGKSSTEQSDSTRPTQAVQPLESYNEAQDPKL